MALVPRFTGQLFSAGIASNGIHTLELYLDYVCPYSAKMFNTIYTSVLPRIEERYKSKVQVIFRQQIQPWHPSSTLVHEAGAAVLRLTPSKFYEFSATLFAHQNEYFDVNVVNETRNDTYKRLACLAQTIGVEGAKVLELLHVSDKPGKDGALNSGNTVTDDVKFMVKTNRLTGVHVTPTVLFNGVVEGSISSSFSPAQWEEWLERNIV